MRRSRPRISLVLALAAVLSLAAGRSSTETALDRYVHAPDPSYKITE